MVAGDVDPRQRGPGVAQRCDLRASLLDRAIGEITGVDEDVRDRARLTAATICADHRDRSIGP